MFEQLKAEILSMPPEKMREELQRLEAETREGVSHGIQGRNATLFVERKRLLEWCREMLRQSSAP